MKRLAIFLTFSFLFLLLFGKGVQSYAQDKQVPTGMERCKKCHQAYFDDIEKSVHGKKAIPNSPANKGICESCHGVVVKHGEEGEGKGVVRVPSFFGKGIDPRIKSGHCLACHAESKFLAFWEESAHHSADLACDNCHLIHRGVGKSLKAGEPEACLSCHRNIRAQANKQSRHPILEGLIKCTSCHDPMGSFAIGSTGNDLKADSINELCYSCHSEKRGPYAWEHPPVPENCLLCHEPHGSNHSYLLVRKDPQLCQSCHNVNEHPSFPYTKDHTFGGGAKSGKNRMFARSCRNCHSNIHGSNHPALGGTLTR